MGSSRTERGYKLCDWRMAYGEVFAPWLRRYDFWGWVDLDVLLGRLARFGLNASALAAHDAVGEHGWPSQGPLTLLRNRPLVTRLWRSVPGAADRLRAKGITRLNEWAFGRELLAAEGLRRRPLAFPTHLFPHGRHGAGDIAWSDGRVLHLPSCGEAAYVHFSNWKAAVAATAAGLARGVGEHWVLGPGGLREADAAALARLRECRSRELRHGMRFAWDTDGGLTPELAYQRRVRE